MWIYDSPIGSLCIKQISNNRYAFMLSETTYGFYATPNKAADDVASFCTGCFEWDTLCGTIDYPEDLSEWKWLKDPL